MTTPTLPTAKPLTAKYRPSLSGAQINTITAVLQAAPASPEVVAALKTMLPFKIKVEAGLMQAGYYTAPEGSTPSGSVAGTLAETDSTTSPANKEDYWAQCYSKYKQANYCKDLTDEELNAAGEHMYISDLFTHDEDEAFDNGTTGSVILYDREELLKDLGQVTPL